MNYYPKTIQNVIRHISRLPGIGEKTAERLTMHLLRAPKAEVEQLSSSLTALKQNVRLCRECFGLSDAEVCGICSNPQRDSTLICVVEQPADMVSIEKAGAYEGRYHILAGVLSPMNGVGPEDIRIKELLRKAAGGGLKEVVLATGTSVEGESTAAYISERLRAYSLKVTRIASGVPVGGDLKYVDQVTLKRAMETRRDI